jgi:hypothetical protein
VSEPFLSSSRACFPLETRARADDIQRWRKSFCGPACLCAECIVRRAKETVHEPAEFCAADRESPEYRVSLRRAGVILEAEEARERARILDHIARQLLSRRAL